MRIPWLSILVILPFLVLLVLSTRASAIDIHGDATLNGTILNERYDVWGNVTVPPDDTLVLLNVTLVFHCGEGTDYDLRLGTNSSLYLSDGDGDPSTRGDRSHISSLGGHWYLDGPHVSIFEISGSDLVGLSGDYCTTQPAPRFSLLSADRIFISDTTVSDMRGLLFMHGNDRMEILDSTFNGTYTRVEASGGSAFVSRSRFQGGEICLYLGSDGISECLESAFVSDNGIGLFVQDGVNVTDCTFDGCDIGLYLNLRSSAGNVAVRDSVFTGCWNGIVSYSGLKVDIEGCTFSECRSAIQGSYTGVMSINGTKIYSGTFGCYISRGDRYTITNTTFRQLDKAIETRSYNSFSFANCSVSDCRDGIVLGEEGKLDQVFDCDFKNVTGRAISVIVQPSKRFWTHIIGCSFENTNVSISCVYGDLDVDDYASHLTVKYCSFKHINVGISTEFNYFVSLNNTFNGTWDAANGSIGIFYISIDPRINTNCMIVNSTFANLERAVYVEMTGNFYQYWQVNGVGVRNCGKGLCFKNVTNFALGDLDIEGCGVGIEIKGSSMFTVDRISIGASDTGVLIGESIDFTVNDLWDLGRNRFIIQEKVVQNATYSISEDAGYEGCNLWLGGAVRINANFSLVHCTLSMVGGEDHQYIRVLPGGGLYMEDCSLLGNFSNPFSLFLMDGSILSARNSTIRRCGSPGMSIEDYGPYATDATVELIDSQLWECYRGLTLIRSNALIRGSIIEASDMAILCERSVLTVESTEVKAISMGVQIIGSNASFSGGRVTSRYIVMDSTNANVTLNRTVLEGDSIGSRFNSSLVRIYDCDLRALNTMMLVWDSTVDLYECGISSISRSAQIYSGGLVRLYNSTWSGTWDTYSNDSALEVYWPQSIAAYLNWSGLPLENGSLRARSMFESYPATEIPLDAQGSNDLFWLMERRKVKDGTVRLSPYTISYSSDGLFGEVSTPCLSPWKGVVIIDDVSLPTVSITSPETGSLFGTASITAQGTFEEMGSGLLELRFRVDGLEWHRLDPVDGGWSYNFSPGDGSHMLTVEIEDISGLRSSAVAWCHVDTRPPSIDLFSPTDRVIVKDASIDVRGTAEDDGYPGLVNLTINGEPVPLDDDGTFDITRPLDDEGINLIYLVASDLAGNQVSMSVVVVRDTISPVITINTHEPLTNSIEFELRGTCLDDNGAYITVANESIGFFDTLEFNAVIQLAEGTNSIEVIAVDPAGHTAVAYTHVVLDTTIDREVLQPPVGAVINGTPVLFVIRVESNAQVRVMDWTDWTSPDANGTVELALNLTRGKDGSVTLAFRDDLGNRAEEVVNITWEDLPDDERDNVQYRYVLVIIVILIAVPLAAIAYFRRR